MGRAKNSGNLGEYLVPSKRSQGGANPRNPSPNGFVSGGEARNRESFLQSPLTVRRRVDPDNVDSANCNVNFKFDYARQAAVVPPGVACEGLTRERDDPTVTMNKGGAAAMALPNITLGAGRNDKGKF